MESIINRLARKRDLSDEEFAALLETASANDEAYLAQCARQVREKYYGKDVYIRGLIEFTNHCRNNCYYCGIRRDNKNAMRYRLSAEQILSCCDSGSVTLSIGEREKSSFIKLFEAGADRYLLRHETADKSHYEQLHPGEMSHSHRLQCLRDLKSIGYQVGCGMMVGSPGQRTEHIIKDLRLLQEFQPEMVGIGPFIPQHDTPFGQEKAGTAAMTLRLLSIIRLLLPNVLLPATTALGTIDPTGREKGLMAGANVLMPNLSPTDVRQKYALYDNKICTGEEAAECVRCLAARVETTGYRIVIGRGDHITL